MEVQVLVQVREIHDQQEMIFAFQLLRGLLVESLRPGLEVVSDQFEQQRALVCAEALPH